MGFLAELEVMPNGFEKTKFTLLHRSALGVGFPDFYDDGFVSKIDANPVEYAVKGRMDDAISKYNEESEIPEYLTPDHFQSLTEQLLKVTQAAKDLGAKHCETFLPRSLANAIVRENKTLPEALDFVKKEYPKNLESTNGDTLTPDAILEKAGIQRDNIVVARSEPTPAEQLKLKLVAFLANNPTLDLKEFDQKLTAFLEQHQAAKGK